jgi:quercetin dioxygenase-like cupin family protein
MKKPPFRGAGDNRGQRGVEGERRQARAEPKESPRYSCNAISGSLKFVRSGAPPPFCFCGGLPPAPREEMETAMNITLRREQTADETFDVLGPHIRFLTALSDNNADYCLIAGSVLAGVVVPIHTHPERETFYVLEGEIEGLRENRWITLGAGGVLDAPGGLKHAWRNGSGAPVQLMIMTQMRLARFLRDIGRPVDHRAPTPADIQRLADVAHAYGYWLGSPADNAAVGISLG